MNKKIKTLMIALQHSAKDDRIFYKEAVSLKNNGYEVSCLILTDKNGYIKDMSGEILNTKKESIIFIDGIKIIGITPPSDMLNSFLKKLFLGSFQHKFTNAIIKENAEIYHTHEPISLRFAFKASKITNKKVIFDSHETWIKGTIKERIIKKLYLRKIKYLITVNEGILSILSKKTKLIHSEVILNASTTTLFPFNREKEIKKIHLPVQIVHEGSFSFNRGLKTILNSILLLKAQFPNINLKIIGGSPKEETLYISDFILKNNLQKNITLTGWVKYEDVYKHLINCDIGLILYTPTKNNLLSTSNKLFNYIASSLAIISVNLPETVKILNPLNNAYILENHSSQELVSALKKLIKNTDSLLRMKNASIQAHQKYNWKIEEKKLLDFYIKVLND